VTEPVELAEARWMLGLCREFHCLPSQLMNEDAQFLQALAIERRAESDG
jgi:hypothetical protein